MENQKNSKSAIGYDLLGTTAIIEFKGSRADAKREAIKLIKFDTRITTVLLKAGPVTGKFRTRKLAYLAGVKKFTVEYKENGCLFGFDPRKTFFSSRLSFERSRILGIAKDAEDICVMFAGAGPFAIELAKKFKGSIVTAIEENPASVRYLKANIKLNKTPNVIPILGDVKKVAKNHKDSADRILITWQKEPLHCKKDFCQERKNVLRNRIRDSNRLRDAKAMTTILAYRLLRLQWRMPLFHPF
jgi:tRNA (guanine37-N1)-methyltransferase